MCARDARDRLDVVRDAGRRVAERERDGADARMIVERGLELARRRRRAPNSSRTRCTTTPYDSAKPAHISPNLPLQHTAISSPGEKRLQIAASSAPRPVVWTGSGVSRVPNTGASSSIASASSRENSGVRWWIIGRAPARSTRSGTRVGPGVMSSNGSAVGYAITR